MANSPLIDDLERQYHENPRRVFARLANEYRKLGTPEHLEMAIDIRRMHVPQAPTYISGYIVLGQALYDRGAFEDARQTFETALDLDPENLIALRQLGDIGRQDGDALTARAWYQRLLEVDPQNEEVASQLRALGAAEPPAEPVSEASQASVSWADINPETPPAAEQHESESLRRATAPTPPRASPAVKESTLDERPTPRVRTTPRFAELVGEEPEQSNDIRAEADAPVTSPAASTGSAGSATETFAGQQDSSPIEADLERENQSRDMWAASEAATRTESSADATSFFADESATQSHASEPLPDLVPTSAPSSTPLQGMERLVDADRNESEDEPVPVARDEEFAQTRDASVVSGDDLAAGPPAETWSGYSVTTAAPEDARDGMIVHEDEFVPALPEAPSESRLVEHDDEFRVPQHLSAAAEESAPFPMAGTSRPFGDTPFPETGDPRRTAPRMRCSLHSMQASEAPPVDNPEPMLASPAPAEAEAERKEPLANDWSDSPVTATSTDDERDEDSWAVTHAERDEPAAQDPTEEREPAQPSPRSQSPRSQSRQRRYAKSHPSPSTVAHGAWPMTRRSSGRRSTSGRGAPRIGVRDPSETPSAFVTETMAELYLQQGFADEALGIYRQLLAQNPADRALRERVDQLERGAR